MAAAWRGANQHNADWSRQITEPSYNLGAVWHPVELDRIRLTIARGVQLPSLIEFAGIPKVFSAVGNLTGNPAISPTVTQSYEIDWDHDFPVIDAQSRVGVFYQTVRNIQSVVSPFGLSFTPQGNLISLSGNVADSNEIGAELSLKGTLSQNWRWRLSYSPRLVRDKFKPGAAIFSTGSDYADMTSRHVVDATLGWSLGPWEVDGFLRFQSSGNGLFLSSRGYAVGSGRPGRRC